MDPQGKSVNDRIARERSSLEYITVDDITERLRPGARCPHRQTGHQKSIYKRPHLPGGLVAIGYAVGEWNLRGHCPPVWPEVGT